MSEFRPAESQGKQVFLTVDDVLLRSEWTDDVPTVSTREIELEEDLRLLDMLEDLQVKTTLFVCGITAEMFPDRLKELAKRGFEIAAHGYRHENFQLLKEDEQKRRIRQSLRLLRECLGRNVLGWRSPGLHMNATLYKMLGDSHVRYCSNIEIPAFVKNVPFGYCGEIELPISFIDLKLYESGMSPAKVRQKLVSAFSQQHGILTLVIHPWFHLRDHDRIKALKDSLEFAKSIDDLIFYSGSDFCQYFHLRGASLYGSALSVILGMWKQASTRIQNPISRMHKTLVRYA